MAETNEVKTKKEGIGISKIIMIVLLALILFLTAAILFFVVADNDVASIMQTFQSEDQGENTILLEEFVVNLKDSGNIKHFIKMTIALMYTNTDDTEIIESNINKIRDAIIASIRTNTYDDMLQEGSSKALKTKIMIEINEALGQDIIKDIYFTDIIIQ